jgi:hypothetical protein
MIYENGKAALHEGIPVVIKIIYYDKGDAWVQPLDKRHTGTVAPLSALSPLYLIDINGYPFQVNHLDKDILQATYNIENSQGDENSSALWKDIHDQLVNLKVK